MKRPAFLLASALALGCIAAVAILTGGDDAYRVRAHFKQISGLHEGADVRVGGVKVGTVSSLDLDGGDNVVATLSVDRSVAPVGRDASAHVRSLNLLGGKYVDLVPGDAARAPVPSGTDIPDARTGAPVELDQVLDVLDPSTRDRLTILLNETGTALSGRGTDVAATLRILPRALDKTTALFNEVSAQNRALTHAVQQSETLVSELSPQRAQLGRLVSSAQRALSATAARADDLGTTFEQAPSTLAQLRATLAELDRTAAPLRGAAASLHGSAEPLTRVLRAVPRATPSLLSTLHTLQSISPSLTTLGREATPVVQRLAPSVRRLARVANTADTTIKTVDESTPHILQILEGWARAIQIRDASGHLFRGQLTISQDLVKSLANDFIRPAKRAGRPAPTARKPATNLLNDTAPSSGATNVKPVTPATVEETIAKTVGDLLSKLTGGQSGATPSGKPNTSLLDYLLHP